ncbi:hypothetical protein, partial [Streptomyces phyllanthi]
LSAPPYATHPTYPSHQAAQNGSHSADRDSTAPAPRGTRAREQDRRSARAAPGTQAHPAAR